MISLFMWSDNWWIENDEAWFVGGMQNILFNLNLKTNECESAVSIPEEVSSKFRLTPFCIKCEDDIFCMPDNGNNIWTYNISSKCFSNIGIENPNKVRIGINDFWRDDNKLFAVSNGLNQVIEINITEKKIENCYVLSRKGNISKSIKVGTDIYSLSGMFGEIYQFDMITKEISLYRLPDIGRKFSTFCFDGEKFWLSGYYKEVYVWNKEENKLMILNSFPMEFGIYNFTKNTDGKIDCTTNHYELPTFLYALAVDDNIWFVPLQTNKIIYVNVQNYEIQTFEITEENETKESLLERTSLCYKYILEYIQGNRYIGLFSIKNNCIIEIDALEKKAKMKYYTLGQKCVCETANILYDGYVFYEGDVTQKQIYITMLNQNTKKAGNLMDRIGLKIYEMMI